MSDNLKEGMTESPEVKEVVETAQTVDAIDVPHDSADADDFGKNGEKKKEKYKGQWNRRELKAEARINLKQNFWVMVFVCLLMAFMFAEYGDSFFMIKAYNEGYKEIQKAYQPKDYEEKMDNPGSDLDKLLEKAGISLNDKGGMNVIAKRGSLGGLVKGLQQKRGIESALADMLKKITEKGDTKDIIIAMLAVLFNIIFMLFIRNVMFVGERRFFLENKNHPKTRFGRIFFLYKERNFYNTALVMFMMNLFISLWMLTIIGGLIKIYSYRLVPYIMAENPDIKWRDAIKLSRMMMNGNKWKCFVFDLSFWYWHLLRLLSVGLVGLFYFNPYVTAAETEVYVAIRQESYARGIHNIELLNDDILYLPEDIAERAQYPAGVVVRHSTEESKKWDRNYTILNLILIFFIFAFVGWCWEVSIHLVQDHTFVNRGTMHGPWLPIYGAGGSLVLIALKKFRDKPILTFLLTFVLCGIVEYVTSWYLEYSKGAKWWDYSGYLLNINGRVCMEGLLIFAIAGSACIYLIGPFFDDLLNKLPAKIRWIIAAVLLACFGFDLYYSHVHPNTGEGITDYGYVEDGTMTGSDGKVRLVSDIRLSDIPRL